ncbi:MAG: type II toxin-antitoxin system VapC family toxin [Ignavibacteriae bacterium]|nr:type II toxin-antitoxin system VapC family toxin [Ignavibacteriota bacterium]
MKFLLDTAIFIWYITEDEKLSQKHREIIRDSRNSVYLSAVSIWEAIVKQQTGKLTLIEPAYEYPIEMRQQHQILPLPLTEQQIRELPLLPSIHRDPFDRMLTCQFAKDKPNLAVY